MAFALFILVNSCKKESDNNEKIDPERKKEMLAYKNGPKVETIPFAQFIQKANLNALGTLKQEFVAASPLKSKTMSIQTDETYFGFKIITDSIKVIKDKGHTMYVFPVSLPSKRAISFQNLTIDESAERTLVFVNTYTPTKKWIADWKEGHAGKFDGEISVTYLNLNNGSTSNSTGTANKKNNQNTISVEQTCTTTTYYFQTPYLCASGNHYPGQDCYLTGDERAGYTYSEYDITTCVDENPGGGGTTTNPPPDYDPCPTDPPTVPEVNNKKSLRNKVMVVPPSECDEEDPPSDIINNLKDPCLNSTFNAITNTENINNKINTLIQGIFNVNDKVNLIYNQSTSLPSTRLGSTDAGYAGMDVNGNKIYNVTVSLNVNVLPGYSKELTAVTILHEALHGYFEYKGVFTADGTAQHLLMATKYVDLLRTSVKSVYPNLTDLDTNILILSEMADIYTQSPQTYNNLLAQYNITPSQFNSIMPTYMTGSAGTRCGNQ
jgi:hypothetical protein